MARLISLLFLASEGVAEIGPEWYFPHFDDAVGAAVAEDYDTTDVVVFGRQTCGQLRRRLAGTAGLREVGMQPSPSNSGMSGNLVASRQVLEFGVTR